MDRTTEKTMERDGARGNERVRIQALAREVLANGPSLMTMAEAVAQAKQILAKEGK